MRLIAAIADLQKIAAFGFRQRSHGPIVDDQQMDPAQPVEQFAMAAIGSRHRQVAKQFRPFEE